MIFPDDMRIAVPSGRTLNSWDLRVLDVMHRQQFVRYSVKPFMLKFGIESHVYVCGREDLTDCPELEWMVGAEIARTFQHGRFTRPDDEQICLIGLPSAGTAFAQAAAMVGYHEQITVNSFPICHRIMKEVPKPHGIHHEWINGAPDPEHQSYWLVDNVATDGKTKLEGRDKMRKSGYPDPAGAIIWIDREQGAVENLVNAGFERVQVIYNLLDLTHAYSELGLWPKAVVQQIEHEIREHAERKHTAAAQQAAVPPS